MRQSTWAGLALAVTATALVVAPREAVPFVDFFPFKAAALALAATFSAGAIAARRARLAGHEVAAVAFVGVAVLSWAIHPGPGAFSATPVALGTAALIVAVATRIAVQERPSLRDDVIRLAMVTAVIVAVLALVESVGVDLPWAGMRRPESTLGNRNFVGAYAAIALPLVIWAVTRRPRLFDVAVLVVLVMTLVVTRCRSAWLGACAGALAVFGAGVFGALGTTGRGFGRIRGLLVASMACAAGVALAASIPWPGLRWSDPAPLVSTLRRIAEYGRGSGAARLAQHHVAAAILRASPLLGVGPHHWGDAATEYARSIAGEHAVRWLGNLTPSSDLLRVATETGLTGLLVVFVGLVLLARAVTKRVATHPEDRAPAVAVGAALVGLAVHALFDAPLYRPETLGLAAVLVGLLPQQSPGEATRWTGAAVKLGVAAGAASAVVLAGLAACAHVLQRGDTADAWMRAQRWYARPSLQETLVRRLAFHGRCTEALAALDVAMRWTPHVWGPLVAAERCARGAERAALHARALALEPELDRLLGTWTVPPGEQEQWLVDAYDRPYPVAVSPAGQRIAVERRVGDAFELAVVDLRGKPEARVLDRSIDPQLDPSLSPDGSRLAFLQGGGGAPFRLHVVDVSSGSAMTIDGPTSETAVAPMAWSPDGSRLAFVSTQARRSDLIALDLSNASVEPHDLGTVSLEATFSWAPDGGSVAAVLADDPTAVSRVRFPNGSVEKRFPVVADGEAREAALSADGRRLAVTARAADSDFMDLYEIDTDTARVRRCLQTDRDLDRPRWLRDGRLAVRAASAQETFSWVGDCSHLERVGSPGEVTLVEASGPRAGTSIALVTTRHRPASVALVHADGSPESLWDAPGPTLDRGCVEPCAESITVPSADGSPIPALLWRAEAAPGAPPAAVVLVHGGPHLGSSAAFDPPTAWLVRSGVNVLSVDYRGSRGHGHAFEQAGTLDERIADVSSAVDYAVGRLGVAREQCVVLGASYGAYLVARASAEGRLGATPIALLSLVRAGPVPPPTTPPGFVLAFHGSDDPVAPPDRARAFVEQTFGDQALSGARGSWSLLPREGHGLHRAQSWAAVFGSIRRWLDGDYPGAERIAIDCDDKCETDRRGVAVDTIVIHATEHPDWETSLQKLAHAPGRSAHYLVGRDGRIVQLLPESYVAWHAGNRDFNLRSIGIEHVGLASEPFTEAQYAASARLVGYLVARYGIPNDRAHVIGHDQVPDPESIAPGAPPCTMTAAGCESSAMYGGAAHHRDPGLLWDWDGYMRRFGG